MWRPWRRSCGNEVTSVRSYVPCEQCEASMSMNTTYTTLTPSNAIMDHHHETLLHRHSLIRQSCNEQPEALTIKSDCESLSDDEVKSNTGSDCYRSRYYYDSSISPPPPPPPLIYYPLERSYLVNNELTSPIIPTLPVASPEVINFIKQRDLDRLVDRIESYNCNDSTMSSYIVPRTMVDNETTETFIPTEDDVHGLTLLSALAEQRALEEESRLECDRYCYPYPVDYRPAEQLTPSSSLSTMRKLTVESSNSIQSVERPISTSSTDCNLKEEVSSDEPTFEPQSNSPIPTTSPPPPPSTLNPPSVNTPTSSVEIKDSSSLPPPEISSSETTDAKSTSDETPTAKTQVSSQKRKRQASSSNEYNFARRSERLCVLESYYLCGIQPPDARRELFEKTPSKSKKSTKKESKSSSSSPIDPSSSLSNSSSTPLESSTTSTSSSKNTNTSTFSANSSSFNESCQQVEASKNLNKCDFKSEETDDETSKDKRKRKKRKLLDNNNVENNYSIKPVTNNVYKSRKNKKPKNRSNNKESDSSSSFLIESKEWNWSGPGIKKVAGKPKSKKTFYKEIIRGKELIKIGDCAVFFSRAKPSLPYVGRIDSMWQSTNGSMIVRLKWFYHPEETKSQPNLQDLRGALFESRHYDQNDVRTILHKCLVLPWEEYQLHLVENREQLNSNSPPKLYYLAGYYDPINGKVQISPEIPLKDA